MSAKPPTVEFNWIGPASARVGEPVTLSLNAKSGEPMASASLQIAYDPLKLAVVEVKEGSLLSQGEARTVFNHKIDPARGRILVSINRGARDGIETGHVLALYSLGGSVRDYSRQASAADAKLRLPDERAGLAFVFRVFDRVSYALVMNITKPISPLDVVQTP